MKNTLAYVGQIVYSHQYNYGHQIRFNEIIQVIPSGIS